MRDLKGYILNVVHNNAVTVEVYDLNKNAIVRGKLDRIDSEKELSEEYHIAGVGVALHNVQSILVNGKRGREGRICEITLKDN